MFPPHNICATKLPVFIHLEHHRIHINFTGNKTNTYEKILINHICGEENSVKHHSHLKKTDLFCISFQLMCNILKSGCVGHIYCDVVCDVQYTYSRGKVYFFRGRKTAWLFSSVEILLTTLFFCLIKNSVTFQQLIRPLWQQTKGWVPYDCDN